MQNTQKHSITSDVLKCFFQKKRKIEIGNWTISNTKTNFYWPIRTKSPRRENCSHFWDFLYFWKSKSTVYPPRQTRTDVSGHASGAVFRCASLKTNYIIFYFYIVYILCIYIYILIYFIYIYIYIFIYIYIMYIYLFLYLYICIFRYLII